jgi:regulator of protease activity HflC (stomatin/prohibitin superfamily)
MLVYMWLGILTILTLVGAALVGLLLAVGLQAFANFSRDVSKKFGVAAGLFSAALVYFLSSTVTVPGDKVGLMTRHYGGRPMAPGRILAADGENGPQAKVLAQGFNHIPFLAFFYDVELADVVQVREGELAMLTAKDGEPLAPDQAFADAFDPKEEKKMIEDAEYYLATGGKKGPQTTVLKPGSYRLNTFLWSTVPGKATEIEKGFVGVVTSNVHSRVDFGNLKREKPQQVTEVKGRSDKDVLSVHLVAVGSIGVWNEPLYPGLYYIHTGAYKVTQMDTKIQTWSYRGGYPRRYIDLEVDDKGDIKQNVREVPAQQDSTAADKAIEIMLEGWLGSLEMRVMGQVTPEDAPYVATAIGDITEVENRIVTPNLRSVTRNVTGGEAVLEVTTEVDDPTAPNGKKLVTTKRAPKALDVFENRETLEKAVLEDMKTECETVRIRITDVRFGEPGMPPELLLARKREQLAQQLQKSYKEEQLAQQERVIREKTKAEAEAQTELAKAEVQAKAAEKLREKLKAEGEGEKEKLLAIAEGQKIQVEALGKDEVVRLRQYELLIEKSFEFLEKNPKLLETALSNAQKFVPERVITVGNSNGRSSFEGAFSILGDFLSPENKDSAPSKK